MSRQTRMTGAQAMTLLEVLYKISQVSRGPHDDAAVFAKFKYTVGWNINQLRHVQNAIAKRQQAIMATNEDSREEYESQRKAIMETYAKRNEKDEIVRDEHGYVFADSAIEQVRGAIDNLRKNHVKALKQAEVDTRAANECLNECHDVLLRCVSLADVPSLVAGGWLPALDMILVDVPGDVSHEAVDFSPVTPRFPALARMKTKLTGIFSRRMNCRQLTEAADEACATEQAQPPEKWAEKAKVV